MFSKTFRVLGIMLASSVVIFSSLYAFDVPQDYSNIQYFYVFGPQGDPLMGAEDNELTLFIDIPKEEPNDLTIQIFDPDTSHKKDWNAESGNGWNTITEFAVYGDKLIYKNQFGKEEYDYEYFIFGSYPKEKGKDVGNFYRFKVVVEGIQGDDGNLFKFRINPDSAEVFSHNITFRLSPNQGDKMYLYPEIAKGTKRIIVENYDLDPTGGTSVLIDSLSRDKYKINDSKSGEWAGTEVFLQESSQMRRLEYVITKKTQRSAHAGLRIKDDKGNLLPIYFRKGKTPIVTKIISKRIEEPDYSPCNKFIFDASESYDPDNQNLSFYWDFGDEVTSTKPIVTHAYAEGGDYKVILRVTDDSGLECNTDEVSQTIHVNTVPIASFVSPEIKCINQGVVFDASNTRDDTPDTLSYEWDFGDGTRAKGKRVTKTFNMGGVYTVSLNVDDNENTKCSKDMVQRTIKINTPPVANAGKDIELCLEDSNQPYKIQFNGSRSRDPDNDRLSYTWDFGDGTTAEGRTVTKTYLKGGEYKVKLTVDDNSGSSCSKDIDSILVDLNRAPQVDAGDNIEACMGQEVLFKGKVDSEDGDILTLWNFGDGESANGIEARHIYREGGIYDVIFVADNRKGTSCSKASDNIKVNINTSPNAKISGTKRGCVSTKFLFDATDSSDPNNDSLNYTWDFGDGLTKEGSSKVKHNYAKGGDYKVTVTVNDGKGLECSSSLASMMVKVNTPPIADAGPNLVCCQGAESLFDASGSRDPDGDGLTYLWNFGDGEIAEGVKVTHVYTKGGTYKVALRVVDDSGTLCNSSTSGFMVEVNEKPTSIIKVVPK